MAQKVAGVYLDKIMEPIEKETALKKSTNLDENIFFQTANLHQYTGTYYSKELEVLRGQKRIYFAKKKYAAGIMDGIEHFNFLKEKKEKPVEQES